MTILDEFAEPLRETTPIEKIGWEPMVNHILKQHETALTRKIVDYAENCLEDRKFRSEQFAYRARMVFGS